MATIDWEDACPKCGRESLQCSGHTRRAYANSGVCLKCGWGYKTKEFQMTKAELKELQEEWGCEVDNGSKKR